MTPEEIKAIRARFDSGLSLEYDETEALLAEVERLTAEVEMLRGVGCMEDGDGPCGVCRKCAFRRGAAAMREAARMSFVDEAKKWQSEGDAEMEIRYLRLAGDVRALPDPEDKS